MRWKAKSLISLWLSYVFHRLTVVSVSFCSLTKGLPRKFADCAFALINSVFWTFRVFGSSCTVLVAVSVKSYRWRNLECVSEMVATHALPTDWNVFFFLSSNLPRLFNFILSRSSSPLHPWFCHASSARFRVALWNKMDPVNQKGYVRETLQRRVALYM